MARSRYYEKLHKKVGLSPANWEKLQLIKGDQTYDKLFDKMFKKMLEEL